MKCPKCDNEETSEDIKYIYSIRGRSYACKCQTVWTDWQQSRIKELEKRLEETKLKWQRSRTILSAALADCRGQGWDENPDWMLQASDLIEPQEG